MKTYLKIPSNIFNSQFDNSEQSKTEGQFLRDSLAKKQLIVHEDTFLFNRMLDGHDYKLKIKIYVLDYLANFSIVIGFNYIGTIDDKELNTLHPNLIEKLINQCRPLLTFLVDSAIPKFIEDLNILNSLNIPAYEGIETDQALYDCVYYNQQIYTGYLSHKDIKVKFIYNISNADIYLQQLIKNTLTL